MSPGEKRVNIVQNTAQCSHILYCQVQHEYSGLLHVSLRMLLCRRIPKYKTNLVLSGFSALEGSHWESWDSVVIQECIPLQLKYLIKREICRRYCRFINIINVQVQIDKKQVFSGGKPKPNPQINLAVQYFYDLEALRLSVLQFTLQNHKPAALNKVFLQVTDPLTTNTSSKQEAFKAESC